MAGEKVDVKESLEVEGSGHRECLDVQDEKKELGEFHFLAWAASCKVVPFTEI